MKYLTPKAQAKDLAVRVCDGEVILRLPVVLATDGSLSVRVPLSLRQTHDLVDSLIEATDYLKTRRTL